MEYKRNNHVVWCPKYRRKVLVDGVDARLKEVDTTALQSSLRNLDAAYQNFFRRVKQGGKPGYSRFKSRHDHRQSYKSKCVGTNIKVLGNAV